jgi:hypothetical protein
LDTGVFPEEDERPTEEQVLCRPGDLCRFAFQDQDSKDLLSVFALSKDGADLYPEAESGSARALRSPAAGIAFFD